MSGGRIKLIINPNADMGNAWRRGADLRPIVEDLGGADWAGTVYPTHATELARRAAEDGYELVVAVGGDGTVHEVVNGLMQVPAERRPRLGVVPLGSGNDFAHNIGIHDRPPIALKRALTGEPNAIDVGIVENERGRREYWANVLGIGFDATAGFRSRSIPVLRGFLMYLIAVIQTIMLDHDAPHLKFSSDEEVWEARKLMLVICNGAREGGGFNVMPDARPDDGILHYACIDHVSRLMMFRLIPEVMNGTHGRFPSVQMGQLRNLDLQSDRPLHIHTDGEVYAGFGTDVRQLRIEIIPAALTIVL